MRTRITALITLIILLSGMTVFAYANSDIEWAYNSNTATLTVSGVGDMQDYPSEYTPWTDYKKTIKNIVIENGITSVGSFSFSECTALESVEIADSVTRMGDLCFYGCTALESISLPNSITEIGTHAFAECTALESVRCTSSGIAVGREAFLNTPFFTNSKNWYRNGFYFGNTLLAVSRQAQGAFTVSNGILHIADGAFEGCADIKRIELPSTIISIGSNAFSGCASLSSVNIPSFVNEFGDWIFADCTSLTYITLPQSMTYIPSYMFYNCKSLKEIKIHNNITEIHTGAFERCEMLGEADIPDSVVNIYSFAFRGCIALERIMLPESVNVIATYAFADCTSVKTVITKGTVNKIEYGAFDGCKSIDSVYYKGTVSDFFEMEIQSKNESYTNAKRYYTQNTLELKDSSLIFKDVHRESWYSEYVDHAYTYSLFSGTSTDRFSPSTVMSRAMFVTVLARIAGAKISNTVSTSFNDVESGKWYTGAVKWAKDNSIVSGVAENRFGTTEPITREQICTMLVRFADFAGISPDSKFVNTQFADESRISTWAKDAVFICLKAGIVTGIREHGVVYFMPQNRATRAEAARMLSEFHDKYLL